MENRVKIPCAIQIRVDDVGWHIGADDRHINRPSRSGLPRMHHPDDYIILNEIGKALNVQIGCSLVLGEWDRYNRLRGVPHVTYDPENWDRASKLDPDYCAKCFENLNGGEYLDFNVHGLIHGYYDDGKIVTERQYYPLEYDAQNKCYTDKHVHLPEDEFRRHLDLFFRIYKDWNFTKKIISFASPCGCCGTPEDNADYARILKDYGIIYWPNGWGNFKDNVGVSEGVICMKAVGVVPWDAFDVDPRYLKLGITEDTEKPTTDYCLHWTNFIRYDPENNMERLDLWVDYFNRQADVFGVMLARDITFAGSQALYNRFAKLDITDNTCTIDLSEVDSKQAVGLKNEFYISIKNGVLPESCFGGSIELYETKQQFRTYKITRNNTTTVKLTLKNG
nr:hypothetical protein [Clostridia bacterium]